MSDDIPQNGDTERHLRRQVQELEARVAERTRELETAAGQLRELSGELLQTQDEERRRIARELHDGVGQSLAALNINLSKLNKEKTNLSAEGRLSLEENFALAEQASREIRTLSYLLHPPLLDEVGLESALRWYVDGFSERSKIGVRMQVNPGFSEGLPRDLALSLFRIVQECLTNVHRHSESVTAFVGVKRSPEAIILEVRDDGKGIDAKLQSQISSGASSGVGFRGMRERIRQFGGSLDVYSDRNGTRVSAVVPISGLLEETQGGDAASTSSDSENHDVATILCIDDEAAGLLTRKLLLESAGHRVIEARSGADGIRLFQSEKVDAVILDYWMSGMKGTAVASELKRINPGVPIIVLSGMLDLPGEAAGLVDRWIIKGSTRAEELLDAVHDLLQRRGQVKR